MAVILFATSFAVLAAPAHATDKVACAEAAEAGQRLFKDHKLTAAHAKLLVCSSTDCPEIISKDCTQWLGEVERNVGSIVVKASDAQGHAITDLRVSADGAVLTEHSTDTPIEIDPGSHAMRFERPGFEPVDQQVEVGQGKRGQDLAVVLHPHVDSHAVSPVETHSRGTALVIGSAIFAGLGVVGMGLYAGFGIAGLSQQNDMKKPGGCAPNCTGTPALASLSTTFTVANVSLVAGLVSLAAAGALFIVWVVTHPKDRETASALRGLEIAF